MTPPVLPEGVDPNEFADWLRAKGIDDPTEFVRWMSEKERHARLATANQTQDPLDSGVGRVGQTLLKVGDAINPFQDELAGAVAGAGALLTGGNPRQAYTETRDAARAPIHEFRRDFPKTAIGLDIAGGVLTPSPFGKVKAVSGLGRVGSAVGRGAAEGAIQAFGSAEGDASKQAIQTLIGSGVGGVLGGVVRGGAEAARKLGPARLTRTGRAADVLAQAAKRNDETLADVVARETPTARNLESAGRPGLAVARQVAQQGGDPATRLVEATQADVAGAPARVTRAVAQAGGVTPADPNALSRSIRAEQRAVAGPQFEAIINEPIHLTDDLRTLLSDPTVRQGFLRGRKIAESRIADVGGRIEESARIPDYLTKIPQKRGPFTVGSTTQFAETVPLRTLKVIKEGLDDLARPVGEGAKGVSKQMAGAATGRVAAMRDRIVQQLQPYGDALASYAGYERSQEYLRIGVNIFSPTAKVAGRKVLMTPAELSRLVANAGPEQVDALVQGAVEAVRRKGSASLTPEQVQRLAAILPGGAADVQRLLAQESERGISAGIIQSAARLPGPDANVDLSKGIAEAGAGLKGPAIRDILLAGTRGRGKDILPEVRDLLAQYLLGYGGTQGSTILKAQQGMNRGTIAASRVGRVGGRAASDKIGNRP